MTTPVLTRLTVRRATLEVPLEDFEHLPRELGCSIHRSGSVLTLSDEAPGCALHFHVGPEVAVLRSVEVTDDEHGRFFRDVLGLLMQLYAGDLQADLHWSPTGHAEAYVEILEGEAANPQLVAEPVGAPDELPPELDLRLPLIEQWLADAETAWREYQRHKEAREKQSQSLT